MYKLNEYLTSSFMFRYFHLQNLPEFFTDYFMSNKDFHNYNTRNASLLHKKFNRTNYKNRTFSNKGLIYGIIFLYNTNKFDLFLYSKRQ